MYRATFLKPLAATEVLKNRQDVALFSIPIGQIAAVCSLYGKMQKENKLQAEKQHICRVKMISRKKR